MKSFTRIKKINGIEYIYEITPYYDPKTKKIRQKSKYLGKNVNGKPVRVRSRNPRRVLSYGEFIPLLSIIKELGIEEALLELLSEKDAKAVLVLALNRVVRPLPLYHVSSWYEGTILSDWDVAVSSQSLSKLLDRISNINFEFSKEIVSRLGTSSTLVYDITSLSSYSQLTLEYGYNRDGDNLPQVNISVVVDKTKGVPVMYDVYPGSIVDVTTLKNTIRKIKSIGIDDFTLVMDRGFFSTTNVEELISNKLAFVIPAPLTVKAVRQLLSSIHREIDDPNLMEIYNGDTIFVKPVSIMGVDGYCYYSPKREQEERDSFYKRLHGVVERLKRVRLRKWMNPSEVVKEIAENLHRYIEWEVVDGRFRVRIRRRAVSQRVNRMGKFVLLYSGSFTWNECLSLYRGKDVVEKVFDTLKNDIRVTPMYVRKENTLKGLIFVCFLATIIRMRLLRLMSDSRLNEKYSVDGVLLELEKIKRIQLSNGESITSELTSRQKEILQRLNLCA